MCFRGFFRALMVRAGLLNFSWWNGYGATNGLQTLVAACRLAIAV